MTRIQLRNDLHKIEWADNPGGWVQARAFRRNHPEFARRKIRRILQLMPSKLPCGEVVEWTRKA